MNPAWLLLLLVYLSSLLRATTIVGIWTENRVTIAADSKQTISRGQTVTGSQNVCKLYQIGDLIMAVAGVTQAEEVELISKIQNFPREYTDASGKKLPLLRISIAVQLVLQEVIDERARAEGRDPRAFDPAGYDPKLNMSLLIAGIIDGNVSMSRITTIPTPGFRNPPLVGSNATRQFEVDYPKDRGRDGGDPNRPIEILGVKDAISRFQLILPMEWNLGDDASVARRLVAIEASDTASSAVVGPPISLITIDKNGPRWIDKGLCQWEPKK